MNPHPPDLESGALAVRATGLYTLHCFATCVIILFSISETLKIGLDTGTKEILTSSLCEGCDVGSIDNISSTPAF